MAEYKVSSSEIMVIFRALHTQDNTQDNIQDNSLTEKGKRILAICKEPKTRREIIEILGYKSIKSIKEEMERLLDTNRLAMAIPDKPKSKNQKYVVVSSKNKKNSDETI